MQIDLQEPTRAPARFSQHFTRRAFGQMKVQRTNHNPCSNRPRHSQAFLSPSLCRIFMSNFIYLPLSTHSSNIHINVQLSNSFIHAHVSCVFLSSPIPSGSFPPPPPRSPGQAPRPAFRQPWLWAPRLHLRLHEAPAQRQRGEQRHQRHPREGLRQPRLAPSASLFPRNTRTGRRASMAKRTSRTSMNSGTGVPWRGTFLQTKQNPSRFEA